MENEKKAALIHIGKITGKLMLITTLTALLLACINLLTEPVIKANDDAKKQAAVLELFPEATDIRSMNETHAHTYSEGINEVLAVYKADLLLGYCADAQAMGFGDYIGIMVAVTPDNRIVGIRVLTIAETPGIGMAVAEQDYLSGYEGLTYPVSFDPGSNHVDAITGATYSSRAIRNGANLVMEYIEHLDEISNPNDTADTTTGETEETGNE